MKQTDTQPRIASLRDEDREVKSEMKRLQVEHKKQREKEKQLQQLQSEVAE